MKPDSQLKFSFPARETFYHSTCKDQMKLFFRPCRNIPASIFTQRLIKEEHANQGPRKSER